MAKNIKLIIGSTRSVRVGKPVANWLAKTAKEAGYTLDVLDLREINLPFFEAPASPMYVPVDTPEAKAWAAMIGEADGFVFLTPEYNLSISAPLKNAIDFLYAEWNDKKASIVSYGYVNGGGSATKHLKDILGMTKTSVVGPKIAVPLTQETFNENGEFNDIDATLGAFKDDFIAQLKALNA